MEVATNIADRKSAHSETDVKEEYEAEQEERRAMTQKVLEEEARRRKEEELKIRQKLHWEKDETVTRCPHCTEDFNIIKRKHHCRACGKIFCHDHCKRWILLPTMFGYTDPERTCDACWRNYSGIDFRRTYDVWGQPDKPAIILLHGALGNRTQYVYQVMVLSEHYRVICMDLPNHGSRLKEWLTVETGLQAIHSVITTESPNKKVILFGHSLGGYMALHFAKKYPDLCSGLVLVGCANETWSIGSKVVFGTMEALYAIMPDSLLWQILPKAHPHIPRSVFDQCILRSGLSFDSWLACSNVMEEQVQGTYTSAIRSFPGQILFLNGERETRLSESYFMAAAQHGTLVTLKDASSMLLYEPGIRDEANQAILSFVEQCGF